MTYITFHVDAVLFDMDGTLVDSTEGVVGAWETFKETYSDIDVHAILNTAHGVRTVENLRLYCGIHDPEELERESERFEQAIVDSSTKNGRKGIVMLPGVKDIMGELYPGSKYPNPCWAICTSATRKYASAALKIVGIPIPDGFVTAEDVSEGKPMPDPYLLGAKKCGVNPENCLVVEDAPAGIRSGKAAGCKTLGVITSHTRKQMEAAKSDYLVESLASVTFCRSGRGVDVTVKTD